MDGLRKYLNENEKAKVYLAVAFVLGILLLTSGSFLKKEKVVSENLEDMQTTQVASNNYNRYEDKVVAELEEVLSLVYGAGNVKCMVTFQDTKETVFATDFEVDSSQVAERDSQSGERTTMNENRDEKLVLGGDDKPVVVKEVLPKVKGIVIVAQGGDNVFIKKQFTDVATALLGVDANKVQILKMN